MTSVSAMHWPEFHSRWSGQGHVGALKPLQPDPSTECSDGLRDCLWQDATRRTDLCKFARFENGLGQFLDKQRYAPLFPHSITRLSLGWRNIFAVQLPAV
jgi:hypothetical protein